MNSVSKAMDMAESYHKFQKYGEHSYFEYHLNGVACRVSVCGEKAICVAYLHDILEDTSCTVDDLSLWFSEDVVEAVVLLSKNHCEDKSNYLQGVKSCYLAKIVKIADSRFNMNECISQGDYNRAKRYLKNLCYLECEDEQSM